MAKYQIADVEMQLQRAEVLLRLLPDCEAKGNLRRLKNKLDNVLAASERGSTIMDNATRKLQQACNDLREFEPQEYMASTYRIL